LTGRGGNNASPATPAASDAGSSPATADANANGNGNAIAGPSAPLLPVQDLPPQEHVHPAQPALAQWMELDDILGRDNIGGFADWVDGMARYAV